MSLEVVLELAVTRAAELLEADKAVLMLADEDGLLTVRASHGLDERICERFREPLHETLIARLQALFGCDANEHFFGVPLVVGGAVTGLLAVGRHPTTTDLEEEEWLLSALADQAAVALEKTRLDEAAEFRERLIGIVSHDLRSPISAILVGASVLLEHDELSERATKIVARMQSSARRACRLIDDVLDFTQARLGDGIRVDREPADIHAIVRQVVGEFDAAHPDRLVEVRHAGDGRGRWDADRLAQVVGNLLSNALKYGAPAAPVNLETRDDGDGVILTVHNQGPAIPAAQLREIFDPMRRGSSVAPQAHSVGLGLYIVKHIVEGHGGTVAVSSSANGTTFSVFLPR
jgi:signal transduction histidine kinase